MLVELARLVDKITPEKRPHPLAIISEAEMLYSFQRRYIEGIHGTNLYDRYGLEEVRYTAANCEKRYGLHIYEESAIVEILNDHDNVVSDGIRGRVIVTSLRNKVMPFIRYETGDQGIILPDQCSCGIASKRLLVFGRSGVFLTINSKKLHQMEFETFFSHFSYYILRFQIAKTLSDKIEIRIIPTVGFSRRSASNIISSFKEQFGFEPEIRIVQSIPLTKRGKTQLLVDESEMDDI